MGKRIQFARRILFSFCIVSVVVSLYALSIISTVIYTIKSRSAVEGALESTSKEPLKAPDIQPLIDTLKVDRGEFLVQQIQSLVDLKALNNPNSIKELNSRLHSSKTRVTYGVSETTIAGWRALLEQILNTEDLEVKKQASSELNKEINSSIVSTLIPRLPESTVRQYYFIKKVIPALPEYENFSSNSPEDRN